MSHVIGRRNGRETYPEVGTGGAAAAAFRNRNVAGPTPLVAPFTPATNPTVSPIAAVLYTPRVSGVVQVASTIGFINGAVAETYGLVGEILTGTGLSVTGGAVTTDGWVMGSTVPPVIGGAGVVTAQIMGEGVDAILANTDGGLSTFAISQPLAVGTPVVIRIGLLQIGGGNEIATLAILNLSVLELP
jgi:hypothetical protein